MSSNNAWSWPNGEHVDYGLAESNGTGSGLVIDIPDFKLHVAKFNTTAGPQCETGEYKRSLTQ